MCDSVHVSACVCVCEKGGAMWTPWPHHSPPLRDATCPGSEPGTTQTPDTQMPQGHRPSSAHRGVGGGERAVVLPAPTLWSRPSKPRLCCRRQGARRLAQLPSQDPGGRAGRRRWPRPGHHSGHRLLQRPEDGRSRRAPAGSAGQCGDWPCPRDKRTRPPCRQPSVRGGALPGRKLPEEAGQSPQLPDTSSWLLFSVFCFLNVT